VFGKDVGGMSGFRLSAFTLFLDNNSKREKKTEPPYLLDLFGDTDVVSLGWVGITIWAV